MSNYINYLRFLNGFYLHNLDHGSVFSNNFSCIKSACKHVPPSCCVIRIDLWDLLCRALFQPRKTCPCLFERLLMGLKESNQTNKQTKIQGITICLVSTIFGSLWWPSELGAVVKYLSFSIHIMITVRVNTISMSCD